MIIFIIWLYIVISHQSTLTSSLSNHTTLNTLFIWVTIQVSVVLEYNRCFFDLQEDESIHETLHSYDTKEWTFNYYKLSIHTNLY
jgi:uncharacterized membrane protein